MKIMKIAVHLFAIVLLIYLGFAYIAQVRYDGSVLWIPGMLSFFGICFNWYVYIRLVDRLSKDKENRG